MRKVLPPAVVLAVAAALTAGCGGSSSSEPPTKAHATAAAQAINLKAADVPGFTGSPEKESAANRQRAAELAKCAGGVEPAKAVADIESESFSRGSGLQTQQVGSDVTVMPSKALAQQDLTAIKSPKGQSCLASFVNGLLASLSNGRVTLSKAKLATLAPSSSGTDGSFGYRVTVAATAESLHIPFYVDVEGFVSGSTEVELLSLSVGQPFPAGEQQRLFGLLVSRAKANPA